MLQPEGDCDVYAALGHPDLRASRANGAIWERLLEFPRLLGVDLYERYPDFAIRVEEEQRNLATCNVVLLQFPLFWYASPPLVKLWLDSCFIQGFAYGPGGEALRGKWLQLSVTAGSGAQAYSRAGTHGGDVAAFLLPWERTAAYCGMRFAPPLVLFGADNVESDTLRNHAESVYNRLRELLADAGGQE